MKQRDDRRTATRLLGFTSIDEVARSVIARSTLTNGRVEAHEFGRNQHSSASAGSLLVGISGIRQLPDDVVSPLVRTALGLIDDKGRVRGHDSDPATGDTTWAESQILLGLLLRPHLVHADDTRVQALMNRLISLQNDAGGWPLRKAEDPLATFAFYPAMALTQAYLVGTRRDPLIYTSILATVHYLHAALPNLSREESILALFALERISSALPNAGFPSIRRQREDVIQSCWSSTSGLRLRDQPVVTYRQPVWLSINWHPLLYLCLRRWVSPLHVTAALLGGEIIRNFKHQLMAWPGPIGAVSLGTGSSWASALALRATMALASDLVTIGASADDFEERLVQLSSDRYLYDVAISFAGADRSVAETISQKIKCAGLRVFYDRDHQHSLLGEDLASYLHSTYCTDSRFAIVVVSQAFLASNWAGNWEWRAMLARMQRQRTGYVLPYLMEEVALPGLNSTLGYVSAKEYSPEAFADLVIRKVRSQLP